MVVIDDGSRGYGMSGSSSVGKLRGKGSRSLAVAGAMVSGGSPWKDGASQNTSVMSQDAATTEASFGWHDSRSTHTGSFGRSSKMLSSSASLGKSSSASAIVIDAPPKLPKIAPQAMSFDEIFAAGRKRVAHNNAVQRLGGSARSKASPRDMLNTAKRFTKSLGATAARSAGMIPSNDNRLPSQTVTFLGDRLPSLDDVQGDGSVIDTGTEASGQGSVAGEAVASESVCDRSPVPETEQMSAKKKRKRLLSRSKTFDGDSDLIKTISGSDIARVLSRSTAEGFPDVELSRMRKAFIYFRPPDSPEMHKDDLNDCLTHLGYLKCTPEICEKMFDEISSYSTLDFSEFNNFALKYSEYEREAFKEVFSGFDRDGSGSMEIVELEAALASLGITPFRETLKEALLMVDADGSGTFSFEEFVTLIAIYRITEGFTRAEIKELYRVFGRFAITTNNGTTIVENDMLGEALLHMFGPQAADMAAELAEALSTKPPQRASVDSNLPRKDEGESDSEDEDAGARDGSKASTAAKKSQLEDADAGRGLTFQEFLIWARRLREAEVEAYHWQFSEFIEDEDGNAIPSSGLGQVMNVLGYTPLQSIVQELLLEVDKDNSGTIEFEEFVNLVTIFRKRDGFSQAELEEYQNAFDAFDHEGNEEVSTMELLDLLRYLGYVTDLEETRDMIKVVDYNDNGTLDFREFLRLMRLHREKELSSLKEYYENAKDGETGKMPGSDLKQHFHAIGYKVKDSFFIDAETGERDDAFSDKITFDMWVVAVDRARKQALFDRRRVAGFTATELKQLQEIFQEYDHDGQGTIDRDEITYLAFDLGMPLKTVPDRIAVFDRLEAARQRALSNCVEPSEAGTAADPGISYWVFIHLIRIMRNERDEKEVLRDEKAMKETQFTPSEAAQFREVFNYWLSKSYLFDNAPILHLPPRPGETRKKSKESVEAAPVVEVLKPRPELINSVDVDAHSDPYLSPEGMRRVLRSFGLSLEIFQQNELDRKMSTMDVDEKGRIDFPDYLRMLRWMMDANFAKINNVAAKFTAPPPKEGEE